LGVTIPIQNRLLSGSGCVALGGGGGGGGGGDSVRWWWCLPGARVVPQLHHVGVVLGQDGHCVTLLSNHQPRLLLVSVAQVDPIELTWKIK